MVVVRPERRESPHRDVVTFFLTSAKLVQTSGEGGTLSRELDFRCSPETQSSLLSLSLHLLMLASTSHSLTARRQRPHRSCFRHLLPYCHQLLNLSPVGGVGLCDQSTQAGCNPIDAEMITYVYPLAAKTSALRYAPNLWCSECRPMESPTLPQQAIRELHTQGETTARYASRLIKFDVIFALASSIQR